MNNKYEVDYTSEDNNNERLPGSVQYSAKRGNDPYGDSNFAKQTSLDAADTGGVVDMPTYDSSGMGQEGYLKPSQNSNVSVTNAGTTLNITASNENLSKKYKYPQVHQDIPAKGNPKTAYNDHS